MIIDGKAIAADILAATKKDIEAKGLKPVVRAIAVSPTPATESYLRIKSARATDAGMTLEVVRLSEEATTEDVIQEVRKGGADAVIIQLPLPASIDTQAALNAIPREKDADVLSFAARDAYDTRASDAIFPPVAEAVKEICTRASFNPDHKRAAVIGMGWLVGAPVVKWLSFTGALVEVLTRVDTDLKGRLIDADIVVSGAGSPHLIHPEALKPGVVLIDAGTSESNGAIVGDANPACAEVASVFTPVPGGVGPIAVACLFRNVARLLTKA